MKQETIDKLKDYEKLILQKRAIENELEMLKEEILPELPADTAIDTDNGTFAVESRVKWIYSRPTQIMEKNLKDEQKREQQDGTAKAERGVPFLIYRESKDI